MWRYFILFLLSAPLFGTELLRNGSFRDLDDSGNFSFWRKRGEAQVERAEEGVRIRLSPGKTQCFLIQDKLTLQARAEYRFQAEIQGEGEDLQYAVYLEYLDAERKIRGIRNFYSPLKNGKGSVSQTFRYPENGSNPYFVIAAKGKNGTVRFRNVSLSSTETLPQSAWKGGKLSGENGETVLRIAGKETVSRSATVVPGKSYAVNLEVRGLTADATTGFSAYRIEIKNGAKTIAAFSGDAMKSVFHSRKLMFSAPESGTVQILLKGEDAIAVKGFSLREISPEERAGIRISLAFPAFRNQFYPVGTKRIAGNLSFTPPIRRAAIALTGADGRILAETASSGGGFDLLLPRELKTGDYCLSVSAQPAGSSGGADIRKTIRVVPEVPYSVIPEGEKLMVQKKTFFAVGIWEALETEAQAYALSRSGVNTLMVSAGNAGELAQKLNLAQKYGIRLVLDTAMDAFRKHDPGAYQNKWQARMKALLPPENREHKALLAYFLADEPAWTGTALDEVRKGYEFLKDLDPYHPVWINEAPRGTIPEIARYGEQCDIFGVDIYPVPPSSHSALPDKNASAVGAYTQRMRESVYFQKPVWMFLQGFAWGEIHEKSSKIYPTPGELRFMIFDAMLHGANGIVFWGVHYISNRTFYQNILSACGEAGKLSAFWKKVSRVPFPEGKNCALFETEIQGRNYTCILNRSGEEAALPEQLKNMYELPGGEKPTDFLLKPFTARLFADTREYPEGESALTPFNAELEQQFNSALSIRYDRNIPYRGKAMWIWKPNGQTAYAKTEVKRRVKINSLKDGKAVAKFACDNTGELYVNGRKAAGNSLWNIMMTLDITPYLKEGENEILIKAADTGAAPCGVLAEITIRTLSGTETILSDASWLALGNDGKWQPAEVIAPNGAGAWGRRVFEKQRTGKQ